MSSNGGPPRPGSARASVFVGLLSVATMPVAIAATRWSDRYELLQAGFAIPIGAALGLLGGRARPAGAIAARADPRPSEGNENGAASAAFSVCSASSSR